MEKSQRISRAKLSLHKKQVACSALIFATVGIFSIINAYTSNSVWQVFMLKEPGLIIQILVGVGILEMAAYELKLFFIYRLAEKYFTVSDAEEITTEELKLWAKTSKMKM